MNVKMALCEGLRLYSGFNHAFDKDKVCTTRQDQKNV